MDNRLIKNTPAIFRKYQEQTKRVSDIEDGNTIDNSLQGKIFTSDVSIDDGYNINYEANIISVSQIQNTGYNFNYYITISYDVNLETGATIPGYYGSNLIKVNDNFLICGNSHDYIKGFINKISSIYSGGPTIFTYTYTLLCTITEGEPLKIKAGDIFKWNRIIYGDISNISEAPPVNLKMAYNSETLESNFYWNESNNETKKHIIQFRKTNNTALAQTSYIKTYGNSINFNGSIEPVIDIATTNVSSIRITDPGFNFSSPRRIEFISEGRGAVFIAKPFSFDGSLSIHDYEVIGLDTGGNTLLIAAKQTYYDWGYPTPILSAYIENLPMIMYDKYIINNVIQISENLFSISINYGENSSIPVVIPLSWTNTVLNSTIKIHNGIERINLTNLSIYTTLNEKRIYLNTNEFISKYLIGCNITSTNFPPNTYITNITNNYIDFNNPALISANGFMDISGNGVNYTSKTRCKIQSVNADIKLHLDPIWEIYQSNNWLSKPEYAVSIAGIIDTEQKNTTQWSEELYVQTIR